MTSRAKSLVLAAIVAIASSGPLAAVADTTGSLCGQVRDIHNQPVAGATVQVASPAQAVQTTSDAHGWFCLVDLIPGAFTLTLEKAGYGPAFTSGLAVNAGSQTIANAYLYPPMKLVTRDFIYGPRTLVNGRQTADVYSIARSNNPLFGTSRTIGELLPFVPGVQVAGGSVYPR